MRARRDDHSLPVSAPGMSRGSTGFPFLPTLVPGRSNNNNKIQHLCSAVFTECSMALYIVSRIIKKNILSFK